MGASTGGGQKASDPLGVGGGCGQPDVGIRSWTWVFYENSTFS